ncbi:unnamed protein product, partial [Coccothraustes coccothraustes]
MLAAAGARPAQPGPARPGRWGLAASPRPQARPAPLCPAPFHPQPHPHPHPHP